MGSGRSGVGEREREEEAARFLETCNVWIYVKYAQQHGQTCRSNQHTSNYAVLSDDGKRRANIFFSFFDKRRSDSTIPIENPKKMLKKKKVSAWKSERCLLVCLRFEAHRSEFNYLSSRTRQSLNLQFV